MPSNPVDQYHKLLSQEQNVDDKYVIIDSKWFEHWKRSTGIDSQPDKNATPGPIDFSNLIDPTTADHPDGVQLRPDAVEGNDYTFIPFELYQILVQQYKKIGTELIRKVIQSGDFQTVIEAYLVPLRVRKSRQSPSTTKQIYRSRRTKLEDLKNDICKMFSLTSDSNYRLYTSTDEYGDNWEAIDARASTILADIELSKNAIITYEPMTLTRNNSSPVPAGTFYTPGLCGLSNLGNTCFMNSALQCISNVPALTDYFLRREYLQHINRDNPLGMKGDVAQAYGDLITNMWSGKINYYAPKSLKQNVARYAPQFSGYSQQDSQEFMSFLLDGLHEDLNLIKQKPYMEKKDDDGIAEDAKLASEYWDYYRKRNQSKIHDIFHGQIKSVVQCLECKTLGRTFDPICFLSLPLPNKKKIRIFKIEYIRLNGQIKYYYIKSNERGRMHNLLKDFCERFQPKQKNDTHEPMDAEDESSSSNTINSNNQDDEQEEDLTLAPDYDGHQPKPELILPVEVYNHRIHLQYSDDALLTNILERDQIVFYEVPVSLKKENNETILMPCLFRTADNLHQNFGLPIYLNIPRHKCTGKHIQDALQSSIGNFLPLSSSLPSDKSPYTASCVFNQNYTQTTKTLSTCLDEHIDFNRTNTTLVVDVSPSVVEKYEQDEKKRIDKDRQPSSSTNNSGVQTRSQHKQSTTSLLDCFKYFTTKETLSDNDQWYCPKCKQLKNASKKIDLWLLPKILIVQLKRFNYTRHYRDKIDLFIDCPIYDLDLSNFVLNPAEKANAKYDLIAVSNHMGGLGGGHYTAHAKNTHDQKWHTFDDSCVTDIDENNVISKSAYVLIYQQQQQQSQSQSQQQSQSLQQPAKESPRKPSARATKTST
ncbi:unnamed protein product [Adineta steineri]|uniref:Ubiquitin carboxyl-terminal hydrolase n=1 Tax=Adineta steineri TaxID=433720 RepID=A0A814W345_9BILA|nr:unnamed protein product [Adineta steineri]CAF3622719.1 unnamed protein product [Adineta steineri]